MTATNSTAESLPDEVALLLWDTAPGSVDLNEHKDYVIERVMSRGGWAAMVWLRGQYSNDVLRRFVEERGARLAPRELAYWALMTGAAIEERPGGGRPAWAGA